MLKRIATATIGIALFASPLMASADTLSDLQAQIATLTAQLKVLLANQTTTPIAPVNDNENAPSTASSSSCPTLTTTLSVGSADATTGGQVSQLQGFLTDNFNLTDDIITGYFGVKTVRYVKQFQAQQGIDQVGWVGKLTRAAVAKMCVQAPIPTPPLPPGTNCPALPVVDCKLGFHPYTPAGADAQGCPTQLIQCVPDVTDSDLFKATPSYGTAPLDVGFKWNRSALDQNAWIDFGDGMRYSNLMADGYVYHTYSGLSTYIARLYKYKDGVPGEEVASKTVVVTGTNSQTSQGNITITAPNGGERWAIGDLNTITWTPYGYNPDINPAKDVDVYLEQLDGTRVGKLFDQGKASLHTFFNVDGYDKWPQPGQYYVRAINRVTGASDRSDGPFTLTSKNISIKVNGYDKRFALSDVNQPITVSWSVAPEVTGCQLSGLKGVSFSTIQPNNGSATGLIEYQATEGGISYGVELQCSRMINGVWTQVRESAPFYVSTLSNQGASVRVVSPNGGEQIDPSKQMIVSYTQTGLSAVSIALYKNDQWKAWLLKDASTHTSSSLPGTYSFIPSAILQGLGIADNAGAIFKIYITGQKADGTGYVDDKSDGAFSFSSQGGATSTATTTPTTGITPIGWFDGLVGSNTEGVPTLYGWVFDPKDTSKSLTDVRVYITDNNNATFVGKTSTNLWRASVNTQYAITGTHGFSLPIPTQYFGTTHTYSVRASDVNMLNSVEIGGSPKTISVPAQNLTATLTANGGRETTIAAGDSINYAWSSTGAVTAASTFTEDSSSCEFNGTGPFSWTTGYGDSLNGSIRSGAHRDCYAGHTYVITYTAKSATGKTASSSVTVHVK